MEALFHRLAALAAFASDNPLTALFYATVAVSILGTLANALSHFPRAQAFVFKIASALSALIKFAGDVLAIIANAKGKGIAGPLTLPGVPTLAKPAIEEAQPKDRGSVPFALLFSGAGALLVGILFAHGLAEAALLAFAVFVALLALYIKARMAIVLLLALGLGSGGCAFFKSPGVRACGTQFAREQAQAIAILTGQGATGDWKMDLAVFEVQAGIELVHCILNQLAAQVVEGADAGPPPSAVVQERAAAHLAEHAPAQ